MKKNREPNKHKTHHRGQVFSPPPLVRVCVCVCVPFDLSFLFSFAKKKIK